MSFNDLAGSTFLNINCHSNNFPPGSPSHRQRCCWWFSCRLPNRPYASSQGGIWQEGLYLDILPSCCHLVHMIMMPCCPHWHLVHVILMPTLSTVWGSPGTLGTWRPSPSSVGVSSSMSCSWAKGGDNISHLLNAPFETGIPVPSRDPLFYRDFLATQVTRLLLIVLPWWQCSDL